MADPAPEPPVSDDGWHTPEIDVAALRVILDGRWADVRDHTDLAGRPRYLTARLAR